MYRIYRCKKCKYTGIDQVSSANDVSNCSLCHSDISHEEGILYETCYEKAEQKLKELVVLTRLQSDKTTNSRGLGVKKRVLRIVESIIDTNRGHPARWNQLMIECSDAGIDSERASHFVGILKREGLLIEQRGGLVMNGEGVAT